MRMIVMFGFAAAMLASPAFADPAATSAQPTTVANSDPMVCHYIYHEGTIIRRPVCLTSNQWEVLRLRQQRELAAAEAKAGLHH